MGVRDVWVRIKGKDETGPAVQSAERGFKKFSISAKDMLKAVGIAEVASQIKRFLVTSVQTAAEADSGLQAQLERITGRFKKVQVEVGAAILGNEGIIEFGEKLIDVFGKVANVVATTLGNAFKGAQIAIVAFGAAFLNVGQYAKQGVGEVMAALFSGGTLGETGRRMSNEAKAEIALNNLAAGETIAGIQASGGDRRTGIKPLTDKDRKKHEKDLEDQLKREEEILRESNRQMRAFEEQRVEGYEEMVRRRLDALSGKQTDRNLGLTGNRDPITGEPIGPDVSGLGIEGMGGLSADTLDIGTKITAQLNEIAAAWMELDSTISGTVARMAGGLSDAFGGAFESIISGSQEAGAALTEAFRRAVYQEAILNVKKAIAQIFSGLATGFLGNPAGFKAAAAAAKAAAAWGALAAVAGSGGGGGGGGSGAAGGGGGFGGSAGASQIGGQQQQLTRGSLTLVMPRNAAHFSDDPYFQDWIVRAFKQATDRNVTVEVR